MSKKNKKKNSKKKYDSDVSDVLRIDFIVSEKEEERGELKLTEDENSSLRKIFEEIFLSFLVPIKQCIIEIQKGTCCEELEAAFRGSLKPLKSASQKMSYNDILDILNRIEEHLDFVSIKSEILTYKDTKVFNELYSCLLNTFSPDTRQIYLSDLFYQKGSSELLEMLRHVKYIGPMRIQRMYGAGLHSLASFENVRPEEISIVTGIYLDLCREIVSSIQDYKEKAREIRRIELREAGKYIKDTLHLLREEKDYEVLSDALDDLLDLQFSIEEVYREILQMKPD